jgi:hypothetical protein
VTLCGREFDYQAVAPAVLGIKGRFHSGSELRLAVIVHYARAGLAVRAQAFVISPLMLGGGQAPIEVSKPPGGKDAALALNGGRATANKPVKLGLVDAEAWATSSDSAALSPSGRNSTESVAKAPSGVSLPARRLPAAGPGSPRSVRDQASLRRCSGYMTKDADWNGCAAPRA